MFAQIDATQEVDPDDANNRKHDDCRAADDGLRQSRGHPANRGEERDENEDGARHRGHIARLDAGRAHDTDVLAAGDDQRCAEQATDERHQCIAADGRRHDRMGISPAADDFSRRDRLTGRLRHGNDREHDQRDSCDEVELRHAEGK